MFPATGTKLSTLLNCQICPSYGFGPDQIRLFQRAPGHNPAARKDQSPSPVDNSDMPHSDLILLENKRVNSKQCQRTVPGYASQNLGGLFSSLYCFKNIPVKTFYSSIFVCDMLCLFFWKSFGYHFPHHCMFHLEFCEPFCSRSINYQGVSHEKDLSQ